MGMIKKIKNNHQKYCELKRSHNHWMTITGIWEADKLWREMLSERISYKMSPGREKKKRIIKLMGLYSIRF